MRNTILENSNTNGVQRTSISLPQSSYQKLNRLVQVYGYPNRSAALHELIQDWSLEHRGSGEEEVLAASITFVYTENRGDLAREIIQLQRRFVDSVIANLSVLLEDQHRMELWVVQGPIRTMREIMACLAALKGIENRKLNLSRELLPPIHGKKEV